MSDSVITATGLGKTYSLGSANARYSRLSETVMNCFKKNRSKVREESFWALRDLSFEVRRGETLGIIGRNGAGKSTLLKLLSRITQPTTGRLVLRGRVASLLEVGTGFHPELTGRENIYLNGAILGMTRAEIRKRFDEIVAFADVDAFLDTPVKRYSSGMSVRLAFAVAAHLEPEILIIDEVLAVGDAQFQKRCLGRIENVVNEGRTVILVSHQMDIVSRLASNVMLLDQGHLVTSGATGEVISRYLSDAERMSAQFPNTDGPSVNSIKLDSEALIQGEIRITVHFTSPHPISRPEIGIVFYTLGGAPVFGSNTLMHPSPVPLTAVSAGSVTFVLSPAPLLTGEYTLSVWLNDGIAPLQHRAHALAFTFQDPLPTASPLDSSIVGPCKIQPSWSFSTEVSIPS
jgi:lipopolysaccharide transport system ATP-binding protein